MQPWYVLARESPLVLYAPWANVCTLRWLSLVRVPRLQRRVGRRWRQRRSQVRVDWCVEESDWVGEPQRSSRNGGSVLSFCRTGGNTALHGTDGCLGSVVAVVAVVEGLLCHRATLLLLCY